MKARRILAWATVLATATALALSVPLLNDALDDRRERLAAMPNPLPATEAEQVAILAALASAGELAVFEGPPPPDGDSRPSAPPTAALARMSLQLCAGDDAMRAAACGPGARSEPVPMDRLEPQVMPLKLRQELVLANRASRRIANVPGLVMTSTPEVQAAYGKGQFFLGTPDVEAAGPLPNGYVEASIAVLSPDRNESVIAIANGCGPDCRIVGKLYRLRRSTGAWRVTDELVIWLRTY